MLVLRRRHSFYRDFEENQRKAGRYKEDEDTREGRKARAET